MVALGHQFTPFVDGGTLVAHDNPGYFSAVHSWHFLIKLLYARERWHMAHSSEYSARSFLRSHTYFESSVEVLYALLRIDV